MTGAFRLDSSSICLKTSLTIGAMDEKPVWNCCAGDIEYRLFGMLQDFFRGILVLVAARHGLVGDLDQAAQRRFLLDDLGVVLDVHRARHAVGEARQVGGAPDAFEFVGALEFFFEGDQVDGLGGVHQLEHLLEDPAMAVEVEVLGLEVSQRR